MKQLISLLLLSCIGIQGVAQTESINLAEGVSLEMVLVQGGSFQMGSNEGNKDNRPAHEVQLDDFYIGKFIARFIRFCRIFLRPYGQV